MGAGCAEDVYKHPLPRALFQRSSIQTHRDALRTLSALVWIKGRIVEIIPSSHPCWRAFPECNGNHLLTFFWVLAPHCLEDWLFATQHHTKPTHTSHSRTRDFFSSGSTLESSSQASLCLTKQSFFTSSTACRTRPRCCFLHTWAQPHFPHALQSDLLPDHLPDLHWCPHHTEIWHAQID